MYKKSDSLYAIRLRYLYLTHLIADPRSRKRSLPLSRFPHRRAA